MRDKMGGSFKVTGGSRIIFVLSILWFLMLTFMPTFYSFNSKTYLKISNLSRDETIPTKMAASSGLEKKYVVLGTFPFFVYNAVTKFILL